MLTPFGVEGGLIYAFSKLIQSELKTKGSHSLTLDLRPDSNSTKPGRKVSEKETRRF